MGFPTDYLFWITSNIPTPPPTTQADLSAYQSSLQQYVQAGQQCGFQHVVNFGIDETTPAMLVQEFLVFDAVHAAGAQNYITQFNTNNPFSIYGLPNRIDFINFPRLSTTDAANWHSVGAKVLNYANPHPYCEDPRPYRVNYGWSLAKNNYDGYFEYAYQACYASTDQNGLIWNDFIVPVGEHRAQCLAYPTTNGVVDTVQYEGMRETINDMRYLATLQKAITNHPGPTADAAQIWINSVDPNGDLDAARLQMASWINQILGY